MGRVDSEINRVGVRRKETVGEVDLRSIIRANCIALPSLPSHPPLPKKRLQCGLFSVHLLPLVPP